MSKLVAKQLSEGVRELLWDSCCDLLLLEARGRVREPRVKGTTAVGRHYQATASEDSEDFMYAVVTVIFGACNFLRLS
jgi:hypothetical protein